MGKIDIEDDIRKRFVDGKNKSSSVQSIEIKNNSEGI
jgi:hypothetical protein